MPYNMAIRILLGLFVVLLLSVAGFTEFSPCANRETFTRKIKCADVSQCTYTKGEYLDCTACHPSIPSYQPRQVDYSCVQPDGKLCIGYICESRTCTGNCGTYYRKIRETGAVYLPLENVKK